MKNERTIIFFVYALLTLILTYPLVIYIRSVVPAGPFLHYDPYYNIWLISWNMHVLFTEPLNYFNANIFYPAKNTLVLSEHMLGNALLSSPIKIFTDNPLVQYNFCFILTIIFSASGMYLLCRRLSMGILASFLAGCFFAYSAMRFRYVSLLQIQSIHWVCFSLFFLVNFLENKKSRDFYLFLVFLFLCCITSIYISIMYFMFLFFFIVMWILVTGKNPMGSVKLTGISFSITVVILLLVLFYLPYFKAFFSGFYSSHPERQQEVISNSANFSSYFFISSHSFFWQKFFPFLVSDTGISPGVILTLLFLIGLSFIFRKKMMKPLLSSIAFAGIMSMLFSFGPKIFLFNLFNKIFPLLSGIRVPERFSMFFLLSMAVIGGIGAERIIKNKLVMAILLLAFLIENSGIPLRCTMVTDIVYPENVYNFIRSYKTDTAILELPMAERPERLWLEVRYTLNSILHWKNIANGYSGYLPEEYFEIREKVFEGFPTRETILYLKRIGIKLIIMHTHDFQGDSWFWLERRVKESPLILVYNDGRDRVYRIPDEF